MEKKDRFSFIDFEVPVDVRKKEAIITIIEGESIMIENYKSIKCILDRKIIVRTYTGEIIIVGIDLEISTYNNFEMTISGNVEEILFEKNKK